FQEYIIAPINFPTFSESLRAGVEIYHALGKILESRNYQTLVGDMGGFSPPLFSNEQGMELLMMAIRDANYNAGEDIFIALDPAASQLYDQGYYQLHRENLSLTPLQLADYYTKLVEKYPIVSIEDPFEVKDWEDWQNITQRLGSKIEIIGDDIYKTNKDLLTRGITAKASTGISIKPNQIGTITQTLDLISMAKKAGLKVIISQRSSETEDSFIADLAVASGCGAIKAGSPSRAERIIKFNRLLEIEYENPNNSKLATWDTTTNSGIYHL
ncbi:MAG: phosphopyruvate hydratase, partial [bacterium]